MSVLEALGQVFLREPYFRNIGKRLVKSPKLYMADTGLAFFLMGFQDWESVERNPLIGALWETHVVMQMVKHFQVLGKTVLLWFWRTSRGEEVDLLIERGGRFIAVECKYSEMVSDRDTKAIASLKKTFGHESLMAG